MRPIGSTECREAMRRLAIDRLLDGHEVADVAEFLGVARLSVRRWWRAYQLHGAAGLAPVPHMGRPHRLSVAQEARALEWLRRDPREFGFVTQRWTAPRLAQAIRQKLGVYFHPRYLNDWLRRRHISPQIPAREARERNQAVVDHWLRYRWPQIQKRGSRPEQPSYSATKAVS